MIICHVYRHSVSGAMPIPGSGQIWMSNVMCGISDTSLDDCPFDGWGVIPNQCSHSMDVQLTCQGAYLSSNGDHAIITFLNSAKYNL